MRKVMLEDPTAIYIIDDFLNTTRHKFPVRQNGNFRKNVSSQNVSEFLEDFVKLVQSLVKSQGLDWDPETQTVDVAEIAIPKRQVKALDALLIAVPGGIFYNFAENDRNTVEFGFGVICTRRP